MSPLILLVIVIALALFLMQIFNRLVTLKNQYLNSFSQIKVQLKRRYDLIPSLVEVAKGYLKHEHETLESVVYARNNAVQALQKVQNNLTSVSAVEELAQANQELTSSLGKLNFVVEAYPELKANENMIRLHEEIATTENRIAFARQAYNDAVMEYNIYKQMFPQNFLAANFGHVENAVLLEFEDENVIQETPKFNF
ncbi:LemA family protein [Sulfurimonas sp.]|uniref:LemA family protein n=1 Tax=Sulfurimonas sp. TaxID=2022749 RepID=UPI003D0BB7FD